jgi:hypothetical protein
VRARGVLLTPDGLERAEDEDDDVDDDDEADDRVLAREREVRATMVSMSGLSARISELCKCASSDPVGLNEEEEEEDVAAEWSGLLFGRVVSVLVDVLAESEEEASCIADDVDEEDDDIDDNDDADGGGSRSGRGIMSGESARAFPVGLDVRERSSLRKDSLLDREARMRRWTERASA